MALDMNFVVDFLGSTHDTKELTDREKHLIGLAVTMTRGCVFCTTGRVAKAREAGISETSLNELTQIVTAVNAGVASRTAALGFEGADASGATACDDGACAVPAPS
jgi:AhpD family alkylhydroperoxidase